MPVLDMKKLRASIVALLFLVSVACSQSANQAIKPIQSQLPNDFHLRYIRGGDPVRGSLLFTEYNASKDGKVVVQSEFVREITKEQRQLSEEQIAMLADRLNQAKLFEFSQNAVELRDRCHVRETDHSRREIEMQWAGRKISVIDDFDPKRCAEVVEFSKLSDDLPELLRGSLIASETKKAPWPRN